MTAHRKIESFKNISSLKRTKIPNTSFKILCLSIKYLENHQTSVKIQDSPLGPMILAFCVYFIKSFITFILEYQALNDKSILKQHQQASVYYPHERRLSWACLRMFTVGAKTIL